MADIADEEFIEEFTTFGVSVNDPAVLDKRTSIWTKLWQCIYACEKHARLGLQLLPF